MKNLKKYIIKNTIDGGNTSINNALSIINYLKDVKTSYNYNGKYCIEDNLGTITFYVRIKRRKFNSNIIDIIYSIEDRIYNKTITVELFDRFVDSLDKQISDREAEMVWNIYRYSSYFKNKIKEEGRLYK